MNPDLRTSAQPPQSGEDYLGIAVPDAGETSFQGGFVCWDRSRAGVFQPSKACWIVSLAVRAHAAAVDRLVNFTLRYQPSGGPIFEQAFRSTDVAFRWRGPAIRVAPSGVSWESHEPVDVRLLVVPVRGDR